MARRWFGPQTLGSRGLKALFFFPPGESDDGAVRARAAPPPPAHTKQRAYVLSIARPSARAPANQTNAHTLVRRAIRHQHALSTLSFLSRPAPFAAASERGAATADPSRRRARSIANAPWPTKPSSATLHTLDTSNPSLLSRALCCCLRLKPYPRARARQTIFFSSPCTPALPRPFPPRDGAPGVRRRRRAVPDGDGVSCRARGPE